MTKPGLAVAVDVAGGHRPAGLVLGVAVDAIALGAERPSSTSAPARRHLTT